ncbi:major facilitator superfamily domain-containing protein [Bisporella sp. PMI_857]|nr:major facilitator superfamily domain-containing protein [Bisporella sp. PMI_857]
MGAFEIGRRTKLNRLLINTNKSRAVVELAPKPSDDARDPLNWPTWKKELAFFSILHSFALACVLKTIFVPSNSIVAVQFNVSYTAATALTGVPFVVAAFTGLGSTALSEIIGKRMLLILSGFLMLAGAMWNMHLSKSYAWFMVSRCVQGLGWGMVDSLMHASIRDMYFVHERGIRTGIMNITSILSTWGFPILGGSLSQSQEGFKEVLMIVTIVQGASILLLILLVPETTFARPQPAPSTSPRTSIGSTVVITAGSPPTSAPLGFLSSLKPVTYRASFSKSKALLPLRALAAPTTILSFLTTIPLLAASFAITQSLSLLFATRPTFLFPARLGLLMTAPLLLSFLFTLSLTLVTVRSTKLSLSTRIPSIFGIIFGSAGLLSFGVYISGELTPRMIDIAGGSFDLDYSAETISLKIVSMLLGMTVAGGGLLLFSSATNIARQPSATTTSPGNISPIETALRVKQDLLTGMFIIAMPSWIQIGGMPTGTEIMMMGLRDTCVGVGIVQLVVGGLAAGLLFSKGIDLERLDRRVLGARAQTDEGIEIRAWDRKGSFSEA